ncbi:MAG: hypothetical protein IKB38_07500 [Clostridia bacterium]|nr:hypothetical protein [Clostridia bacterium]
MKKKVLLSSLATIALCLSLIAGSTFALFTSNTEMNVAVSSATVKLVATVDAANAKLYSYSAATPDTPEYMGDGVKTFTNGGEAIFNGNAITINRMTPGDKIEFDINMENSSDVTIQYRVAWTTESDLADVLVVSAVEKDNASRTLNDWAAWATDEIAEKTVTVTLELPAWVGNEYQTKSATIYVSVEAVQGNAIHNNTLVEPQNPGAPVNP